MRVKGILRLMVLVSADKLALAANKQAVLEETKKRPWKIKTQKHRMQLGQALLSTSFSCLNGAAWTLD